MLAYCALVALFATEAHAQFTGFLQADYTSSSNVEATTPAVPDNIFTPGVTLYYEIPAYTGTAKYTLGAAYAPTIYGTNSRSYNTLDLSAYGLFYLSNREAIAQEYNKKQESASSSDPAKQMEQAIEGMTSDSLLEEGTNTLYLLALSIDSITYKPSKSLSASQILFLKNKQDSLVDILLVLTELTDSLNFTQSVKEIIVDQLKDAKPLLQEVVTPLKGSAYRGQMLERVIYLFSKATPMEDFLGLNEAGTLTKETANEEGEDSLNEKNSPSIAPFFTTINSSSRMQYLSAQYFTVAEDAYLQTAKTLATTLFIPAYYELHSPRGDSNYLFRTLTFSPAVETFLTPSLSVRLNYNFNRTIFPNDSVYSNSEHFVRLSSRFGIANNTALFGEAIVGFKNYLTPLKPTIPRGVPQTQFTTNFTQYVYGLGVAQFIGDRLTVGTALSLSTSPSLRGYITTFNGFNPLATQTHEDEYTYNFRRVTLFGVTRMPWDLDLSGDFYYEYRKYGAILQTNATVINELTGANRTEDERHYNFFLGKLFVFASPLVNVFSSLFVQSNLAYTSVNSSLSQFSYTDTSIGISAALGF